MRGYEQSYAVACLESEVDRFVPTDLNVPPSAKKLGSRPNWLSGLERGEGRLPLSSGPRASSPALAGRGAAAGVYHTPEGSPPGGLSGPGAWVLHMSCAAAGAAADFHAPEKQQATCSVEMSELMHDLAEIDSAGLDAQQLRR